MAQDRRVLRAWMSSSVIRLRRWPRRGVRRGAGRVDRRAGERPGLAGQRLREHDLAEAVVVEVLGDHERLREADEHALVPLGKS